MGSGTAAGSVKLDFEKRNTSMFTCRHVTLAVIIGAILTATGTAQTMPGSLRPGRGGMMRRSEAPGSVEATNPSTTSTAAVPPVLISRCLSSVCIGDDIEKISLAKVRWVALPFVKENIDRYTGAPNIMQYRQDPKTGQSVKSAAPKNEYLPSFLTPGLSGSTGVKADVAISQSFRGLTDNDAIRLALYVGAGGVGPSESTRHQIFNANQPGPDGIAITPESLALLRKATAVCSTCASFGNV
jgi:hypothetical protein